MTNLEAMKIAKDAATYSIREKPNTNIMNAAQCFAEIEGNWTKENSWINFVKICLEGAEKYKANHAYKLKDANPASNVALYIDMQAASDISKMRSRS